MFPATDPNVNAVAGGATPSNATAATAATAATGSWTFRPERIITLFH